MKTKMKTKLIILLLSVFLGACSNNHEEAIIEENIEKEENNIKEEAILSDEEIAEFESQVINVDEDEFTIATHISSKGNVKVNFLKLPGNVLSIAIDSEESEESELIKFYQNLITNYFSKKITLDGLYKEMEGASAKKEVVEKLKEVEKENNKLKIANKNLLSKENEKGLQKKLDKYLTYRANCNSNGGCHGPHLSSQLFRDQFCNTFGLPNGSRLLHCRTGGGPSIAAPTLGYYYKVAVQNSYNRGAEGKMYVRVHNSIYREDIPSSHTILRFYESPVNNLVEMYSSFRNCPSSCFLVYHSASIYQWLPF